MLLLQKLDEGMEAMWSARHIRYYKSQRLQSQDTKEYNVSLHSTESCKVSATSLDSVLCTMPYISCNILPHHKYLGQVFFSLEIFPTVFLNEKPSYVLVTLGYLDSMPYFLFSAPDTNVLWPIYSKTLFYAPYGPIF